MNLSAGGDENLINSTPTKKPVSMAENVENGGLYINYSISAQNYV